MFILSLALRCFMYNLSPSCFISTKSHERVEGANKIRCAVKMKEELKGVKKKTYILKVVISSVQFSHSVLSNSCDPMDCSMTGFPVHHQLPEFAQSHVHRVGDAIQPSHPLSSPSPPAFSLSQHQGLFQ